MQKILHLLNELHQPQTYLRYGVWNSNRLLMCFVIYFLRLYHGVLQLVYRFFHSILLMDSNYFLLSLLLITLYPISWNVSIDKLERFIIF
ncbi:Uncharacterised protein [Streptococcus pneumoniae]|nr:Uncharacterised protein [Streptococcus pneumoniae]